MANENTKKTVDQGTYVAESSVIQNPLLTELKELGVIDEESDS